MIKEFSILISLVLLLASFVILHYVGSKEFSSEKVLSNITKITNISSMSQSVAYYEPRILFYEKSSNTAYPQMQTINKMDLVYEQ